MKSLDKAMQNLNKELGEQDTRPTIPFEEFLIQLGNEPSRLIRNVFQVFHDMIEAYVESGFDEYPDDPESIHYISYDCTRLFVKGVDHPFFADRLFANRLINHVEALKLGAQQNKIYVFEGPHGCGKSTFLNNMLKKFEEYVNTEAGMRYETVWHLNRKAVGDFEDPEMNPVFKKFVRLLEIKEHHLEEAARDRDIDLYDDQFFEIPCPSHDNPILMIPKHYRRQLFDDIFENDEFKWKLYTEKEYEWVFQDVPCTICSSLYDALLQKLQSPMQVFSALYARPYRFNRRLGEGISVFNPGDRPLKQNIMTNNMLQKAINRLFKDSNQVKYIFSNYAKTNNGIYALMDIKSHNVERLIELHNIVSERVHKVEDIEENVNCLFFALMNPEDKKNIENIPSFSDRIEYIYIPYVLDLNTEVEIYCNIFGQHIKENFLPGVLHNFARVIIATRLNIKSESLLEWIGDPGKYTLYCDKNLHLLKMEIFTGNIPEWLTEEDRKRFTAKRRRNIIAESIKEGRQGFSGRDSIRIFNEFYSSYAREDKLIKMDMLIKFFEKYSKEGSNGIIPKGFLDSLQDMYDYKILQKVKESLYYYNEEQISREIQNYLFAVNFEIGSVTTCKFTTQKLEITEEFLSNIEDKLLGARGNRNTFRKDTQKEYTSSTLAQEIMRDGLPITKTKLYKAMHERYVHNLKAKVLDPFLKNENFRRAIKDYDSDDFKTYDKKIQNDVTFLMNNLGSKYRFTEQGAREVCMYVIDNELAAKFEGS